MENMMRNFYTFLTKKWLWQIELILLVRAEREMIWEWVCWKKILGRFCVYPCVWRPRIYRTSLEGCRWSYRHPWASIEYIFSSIDGSVECAGIDSSVVKFAKFVMFRIIVMVLVYLLVGCGFPFAKMFLISRNLVYKK